jgi:signal transduction histidine kinase
MDRSIYEKDSTKGIGLSTIEARARIMKGDFIIRKLEDNGTYIKVSVPIEGVY